jgi:hypothetical protein
LAGGDTGGDLVDAARYLLLTCGNPIYVACYLLLSCGYPFYATRYLLLRCGHPVCAARHPPLTGGNTGGDPVDALPHGVEIEQYCVRLLLIRRRGRSQG